MTKELKLTQRRVKVLSLLRTKSRGMSVREMCDAVGARSPNAVHEVLREAKRAGIAETDGRAGGWHLTERGESVVRALAEAYAAVDRMAGK